MRPLRFSLVVIALIAIFHFVPLFNRPEAAVTRLFSGLAGGLRNAALAVVGIPGSFGHGKDLETENARLKGQMLAYEERLSVLAGASDENVSLRALLAFKQKSDTSLISANVIGADPDVSTVSLVIDRGSEDGVRLGDPVVSGEGVLVGKIVSVAAGRSTVLLCYDHRSRIAAMVQGHPESNGVASGERGLVIRMTLIPQNAPIEVGDVVVTTGLEPSLPRGLIIGSIDSVSRVPSEPFTSATVVPAADALHLTAVAVLTAK